MNMFSTGNREEDELLRLLRQGLITPEQLEDMSSGQQAAQELRGGVSDTLTPMGSRRDTTVRAAASLQPETTAMAQAPAQRASMPMASRSEGIKERGLEDLLKDRASTAAPMLDQRREEDGQPRFVNTFTPRGYLPEEKAELSIRERARGKQDPKIAALNATPVERGLLPGERAEEETPDDESFDPSLGRYEEMPIVMEETIVTPNDGDAEEDQQSFLSRIGSLIANNPELAASGAQLLGGLLSNAAQNRAQRRADRTTDQRVARANLISAITGGRARPTVERAQADTGGFMSLDTLGKALQGGGAAVKGELARQVAEDERERRADLDERGMKASELGVKSLDDYRKATLAFNKKKFDKETQLAAEQNVVDYLKAAKDLNESERIPIKEIGELSSELASLKRLDNLEDFIIDADFSFLEMGPLRLEEPSQFIFGSDARVAESAIQGLIAEVAKTIPGVLTEGDQKRLETRLLSLNDTESTALDVAQAFREELLVKFEERLGALKESGGFDTTYFDDRLMEYRQGRGAQGFESMLTKDEIVLGG
jgi:hypothetical protein